MMKKYIHSALTLLTASVLVLVSCTEKMDLVTPEEVSPDLNFDIEGVSFRMVRVDGGIFRMGCEGYLFDVVEDELPTHNVQLSGFWIGETEVTQALWQAVMGYNPSLQNGVDSSMYPVENVSYADCKLFVERLSEITGRVFALPTEAQWEYAARGGALGASNTKYSGSNQVDDVAWYYDNAPASRPIKGKLPNELGLYDMSGNVSEWCNDWYGIYSGTFQENPMGHHSGVRRVVRGGDWTTVEDKCRSTARGSKVPNYKGSNTGLRLVVRW